MHLKRLEAFGFKSFADKVVFDFEKGFTCFVGPNGCGKSNVVDAFKWVLGEQSAKSLRGGEMLDVVFNGTSNRKPLNFAEVTLLFDNTSGKLPLAAPEVSVTRRLYRSGDSEYLINKALCRLRDVRELFWDTGIGTSSYSVIEQGRVAALLEANSKDRRVLFEEAAGIHKYKERKRIALRKLERVEQNLARLNDLLGEVERNLKAVTRQAEKARKAKELTDTLRQARIDILLHDAFSSREALREAAASLALAEERVAGLAAELTAAQALTAEHESAMAQLDARLTTAQQQLSEAGKRLHRLDAETEAERRQIQELHTESERARASSAASGERAAAIALERERAELDVQRAGEQFRTCAEKAAELSAIVAKELELREARVRSLEGARKKSGEAHGRRVQLQDTLTRAEAELGSLEYRVRRTQAQMTRADDQLRFAQAESEEIRRRSEQVKHRKEMLETEQMGMQALQHKTQDEIDSLGRTIAEQQRELEQRRSRLAALEGLRESGEGLSPGARAVLTTLRHELHLENEIHGLAVDCLNVEPRLEQAIEAALGDHVETIVVETAQTARILAAKLSETELGRARFLPLDSAAAVMTARKAPEAGSSPGYLGRASEMVSCKDRFYPVARALLGDVFVYDTAEFARAAFGDSFAPLKTLFDVGERPLANRVSLDGEFFESSGTYSAGKFKAQRVGLIARNNEIARLGGEIEHFKQIIESLAERSAYLEKRAQRIARDDERLRIDINALAMSLTELKGMQGAIEREESRSAEEKNLAVKEIHELEAERAAHIARVLAMREELEQSKLLEASSAAAVDVLDAEHADREQIVTAARGNLAAMEREAATWRERVTALEREGQSLSAQFADRRDDADRERHRANSLVERRAMIEVSLAEKDATRGTLAASIETLTQEAGDLQQQKDAAREGFDRARGSEREIATEQQKANAELSAVREREVNFRVRLEGKLEQARAEFQMDADAELNTRGAPPEIAADALEVVRQIEEKLARMGPVNMFALEEQQELEKRHSFLKVQFEDLDSARASLKDVISRINRRSRTLFQETFESVKGNFNEIFRKLFGGGKAELVLEEGEDILEAGIEIIARPPGKEPRSVTLLSGGEKTMTMIALLFAVFRSRPAPFCILDEVDAPLDEANVDRFNQIVKEFTDQSQFLVITHNKITMSYANILYGITMPEAGVSKRIAIKFEEIERHLPMDEIEKAAQQSRREAADKMEAAVEKGEDREGVQVEAELAEA
ncbi:MAG TPA: chromosome segregation protein SMC [Planctomycetota bacterium]|nr:chromosome segregation protein SMC [Planctomycetota bacterium]